MSVISVLEALSRPSKVEVITDSVYVAKGCQEWMPNWKRNGWKNASKKPVKNADLWKELDSLAGKHEIVWHWVKGHSGHPENERADELANLAIDAMLGK